MTSWPPSRAGWNGPPDAAGTTWRAARARRGCVLPPLARGLSHRSAPGAWHLRQKALRSRG